MRLERGKRARSDKVRGRPPNGILELKFCRELTITCSGWAKTFSSPDMCFEARA